MMATTRTANAHWEGSLIEGAGTVSLDSSHVGSFDVTWASRSEKANDKTSPEELIAAAHSTCFSMALSHALAGEGHAGRRARGLAAWRTTSWAGGLVGRLLRRAGSGRARARPPARRTRVAAMPDDPLG